jgi:outer membrane receptor protein involved in Fe transport
MLPAPFNGLLVGVNGALTDSRANVARFDSKAGAMAGRRISMPGQSDRVMNLMLGYEAGPVSTRIALNYKSPYLLELGPDILNSAQDRMVDIQKQVDFSLSWQVSKGVQLSFDVANLNNEKYYVYQGVKTHNAQYEQYGRTFKLGLKASVF